MRKNILLSMVAVASLLGACGGGGGGDTRPVVTPPAPEPSPPPEPEPEPETIHDLKTNRTFTADAAFSDVTISRMSGDASDGTTSTGELTISYDAAAKSYTVGVGSNRSTFSQADIDEATTENFVVYLKERASSNEQLILLRTALDGSAGPQHVALGLLQQNTLHATTTDTAFSVFVYGFEAPVSAVPRTGTGSFTVDVFGLTTFSGAEPSVLEGTGYFDIDFGRGIFATRTELLETGILTGTTNSGTGFELTGAGKLSGSDGTFSGQILYSGSVGKLPGTLSGRFYGPDATELGASFSASDDWGATVSGGMVGFRSSDALRSNLTLTDLVQAERISTSHARMVADTGEPLSGDSQLYLRPDGSLEFTSGIPTLSSVALTTDSLAASADPNFTAYEKTADGRTVRLEMYQTGQANTELKLTYASFGQWRSAPQGTALAEGDRVFFDYGLRTPEGALTHRTGSAHYEGVAYGAAFNTNTSVRYDVTGTSRFDVNFSYRTYDGHLALAGKASGGAGRVDFGTYQFGGVVDHMNRMNAVLIRNEATVGWLNAGFYGPNGEEIAGSFNATVMDGTSGLAVSIVGATVATQR